MTEFEFGVLVFLLLISGLLFIIALILWLEHVD